MNFMIRDSHVFFIIFNYIIWAGIKDHIAHVRKHKSFSPLQVLDHINDTNNHLYVMYIWLLL